MFPQFYTSVVNRRKKYATGYQIWFLNKNYDSFITSARILKNEVLKEMLDLIAFSQNVPFLKVRSMLRGRQERDSFLLEEVFFDKVRSGQIRNFLFIYNKSLILTVFFQLHRVSYYRIFLKLYYPSFPITYIKENSTIKTIEDNYYNRIGKR